MASFTADSRDLQTVMMSHMDAREPLAARKLQSAPLMSGFASRSPIGVVDCAAAFFPEEHLDNASTTGSEQDHLDVASASGSEQSCDESAVLGETLRETKNDTELQAEVHTTSQASCEVRPTFSQRTDGSFVMELPSIDAKINTTCFATEPLPADTEFRPNVDVCLAFPEVELLVFDPVARTPAGMCMAASAHKCVKVLDVPLGYSLISRIATQSTSGKETLKERLYTNGCRNRHSDVDLNYELRVSGSVSTSNHQLILEIDFAFRCWLSESAMGYLHEGEWWGLVATQPFIGTEALTTQQSTEFELSYMEHRAEEIYDTLSSAHSGTMSATCLSSLQAELAQLEKDAEICESLFHDACLDGSPGSRGVTKVAESPQKNMVRRFLNLYQRLEQAQYKAIDIKQVK